MLYCRLKYFPFFFTTHLSYSDVRLCTQIFPFSSFDDLKTEFDSILKYVKIIMFAYIKGKVHPCSH